MRRSDYLILTGSLLVLSGLVLQITLFSSGEESFFFVFPFVFVGTGALGALMALIAAAAMFVIGLRFCVFDSEGSQSTYLRTRGMCDICGQPMPEGGKFCPYCGAQARNQQNQHNE